MCRGLLTSFSWPTGRNRFGGWIFLAAAVATAAVAGPASASKRVALVIGNSAYAHSPRLANPPRDADAIEGLFKAAGFDAVDVRKDLGGQDLKRALRDFSDKVQGADIAVVFFAGHGVEVGGINYLIPVDAKLDRDIDVEDEAVPLNRVLQLIEPAKRLKLVILDACRDNPFVARMLRKLATRSIGRGLAKVEVVASDTAVAFAAKAGSTALDGSGENSPFTIALVKHLVTPGLDLRLAFGRVRDEVLNLTNNRQEPFVYNSLGGSEIALVPVAAKAAVVTPSVVAYEIQLADKRKIWGDFRKEADGRWVERVQEAGGPPTIYRFVEKGGNDQAFLLFDASRDLYVQIQLENKRIWLRQGSEGRWQFLYNISNVTP
jgi:hypothetical protein